MISQLRSRIPKSMSTSIRRKSTHRIGPGGKNWRIIACCLLGTILLFFFSIHKARTVFFFPSLKSQAKQLDKLLAEMRATGVLDTSLSERNKSKEAYATVLYYDGSNSDFYMYACAAASLGLALMQIDPARPRVALVTGLTEEARDILTDGGIWDLVDVPPWSIGSIGGKQSIAFERKAALWDLAPYERVLFIDSDAFLVPDKSGQRLKRLESIWQLEALGKWHPYFFMMPPGSARGKSSPEYACVQSSHILLEPDPEVSARYRAILQDPPHPAFTDCLGKDQKVLSYLFPHFAALHEDLWRTFHFRGKECDVVLGEEPAVDEIHLYFHKFKARLNVQPFWGGDCTSCILEGKTCKYPNSFTRPCHKKIVELWWERLMELPSKTANTCVCHLGANLDNADEACYG